LKIQTLLMGVLHEKLDLQGHYSLLTSPSFFSFFLPSLYLFNFPPLFFSSRQTSHPSLYLFNFFLLSHTQCFFFSAFFFLLFFISPAFFFSATHAAFFLLSHTRLFFFSAFFSSLSFFFFFSPQR
jgi:hypothetical protein